MGSGDGTEILSTWINPCEGISNCVICLETSAGLGGRQGERGAEQPPHGPMPRDQSEQPSAPPLPPLPPSLPPPSLPPPADRHAGGHGSLGSYHLDSATPCLCLSNKHKQKTSPKTIIHTCHHQHGGDIQGKEGDDITAKLTGWDFFYDFFISLFSIFFFWAST